MSNFAICNLINCILKVSRKKFDLFWTKVVFVFWSIPGMPNNLRSFYLSTFFYLKYDWNSSINSIKRNFPKSSLMLHVVYMNSFHVHYTFYIMPMCNISSFLQVFMHTFKKISARLISWMTRPWKLLWQIREKNSVGFPKFAVVEESSGNIADITLYSIYCQFELTFGAPLHVRIIALSSDMLSSVLLEFANLIWN